MPGHLTADDLGQFSYENTLSDLGRLRRRVRRAVGRIKRVRRALPGRRIGAAIGRKVGLARRRGMAVGAEEGPPGQAEEFVPPGLEGLGRFRGRRMGWRRHGFHHRPVFPQHVYFHEPWLYPPYLVAEDIMINCKATPDHPLCPPPKRKGVSDIEDLGWLSGMGDHGRRGTGKGIKKAAHHAAQQALHQAQAGRIRTDQAAEAVIRSAAQKAAELMRSRLQARVSGLTGIVEAAVSNEMSRIRPMLAKAFTKVSTGRRGMADIDNLGWLPTSIGGGLAPAAAAPSTASTWASAVSNILGGVASVYAARQEAKSAVSQYKTALTQQAAARAAGVPDYVPPRAEAGIGMGTILAVGGVALAGLFILPKLLGKKKRR